MLSVISPAKSLDFDSAPVTSRHSQPDFLEQAQPLIDILREQSPQDIASLMKLSDKLAGLNAARFQEWQPPFTPDNAKQAVLAFQGDVYQGMAADSFSEEDFERAQHKLRILSGLYGLLRPLDLIQPYRLEMGTRLSNPAGKDLYAYWRKTLTPAYRRLASKPKPGSEKQKIPRSPACRPHSACRAIVFQGTLGRARMRLRPQGRPTLKISADLRHELTGWRTRQ